MTFRLSGLASLSLAAFFFAASPVAADGTKAQCVQANTRAQSHRREGKFAEAREDLRACGDPKCPAMVRTDCIRRLDELESAQPTIVFDAKDGSGHDLSAVSVTMDGTQLVDRLDGTTLQVDPGKHEFTFTAANQSQVTQTFVLSEGQKGRHESIVIGSPPPTPPPEHKPVEQHVEKETGSVKTDEAGGLGTQRVVALAAGGLGVVGIAVGSIFGAVASSTWSQAQRDCGPACSAGALARKERSDALTQATTSTIGFIVGGVGLAAGGLIWFTSPRATRSAAVSGRLVLTPSLGPNGGALLVRGKF